MSATKVKICGITNLEDAKHAIEFGADVLGFNFYPQSPRFIIPKNAREIIELIASDVEIVGVFVNESVDRIAQIYEDVGIEAAQLHGDETPSYVDALRSRLKIKIMKAHRVSPDFKPEDISNYQTDAALLDAYSKTVRGGTGECFDWEIARAATGFTQKLYLAGGLIAENVADAVRHVRPYAVDVASGVESSPGKKDPLKLEAFIRNAKNA